MYESWEAGCNLMLRTTFEGGWYSGHLPVGKDRNGTPCSSSGTSVTVQAPRAALSTAMALAAVGLHVPAGGWNGRLDRARRPSGQPVDRGHQRPRAAPASRHHLSVDSRWRHRRQHDHSCAICYEAADNRRFCTSRVRALSSGLQILSSTSHTPDIIPSSPSSSIRNGTLPSATFLGGCPPAPLSSKENTDPSSRLHEPPESSPAQTSRNQLPPVRSAWRPPAPAPAPSRLLSRFGSRPKPSQGWPRPGSAPWSAPAAQPASNCGRTVPSHQIATIRAPVRRLRCAWGDTACWLACSLACLAAEVLSARPLHCSQWSGGRCTLG